MGYGFWRWFEDRSRPTYYGWWTSMNRKAILGWNKRGTRLLIHIHLWFGLPHLDKAGARRQKERDKVYPGVHVHQPVFLLRIERHTNCHQSHCSWDMCEAAYFHSWKPCLPCSKANTADPSQQAHQLTKTAHVTKPNEFVSKRPACHTLESWNRLVWCLWIIWAGQW